MQNLVFVVPTQEVPLIENPIEHHTALPEEIII
jgi:hypothetical protein